MHIRQRRTPDRSDVDLVDDGLESWVERLSRLVLLLTALADRYERALERGLPAAALARVAQLRGAAESGREALVHLALDGRTGKAQDAGDGSDGRLGAALTSRTMIGQAQGVLMYRYLVTPSAALEMLLIAARDRDVTLGQVARAVIGTPRGSATAGEVLDQPWLVPPPLPAAGVAVTTATTAAVPATSMFDMALTALGRTPLTLRAPTWSRHLPLARWCGDADAADTAVLDRYLCGLAAGARVLDLGCGPGRHAAYLQQAGLEVLGVDVSPTAAAMTRRRGASAVRADALGPLPGGDHSWDGVVLLDGNIGIGGDPVLLLCRVRDLLAPHGRVLVELDRSGVSDRCQAVLDDGQAVSGDFPWARLSHGPALDFATCAADLQLTDNWTYDGKVFIVLSPGRRL